MLSFSLYLSIFYTPLRSNRFTSPSLFDPRSSLFPSSRLFFPFVQLRSRLILFLIPSLFFRFLSSSVDPVLASSSSSFLALKVCTVVSIGTGGGLSGARGPFKSVPGYGSNDSVSLFLVLRDGAHPSASFFPVRRSPSYSLPARVSPFRASLEHSQRAANQASRNFSLLWSLYFLSATTHQEYRAVRTSAVSNLTRFPMKTNVLVNLLFRSIEIPRFSVVYLLLVYFIERKEGADDFSLCFLSTVT